MRSASLGHPRFTRGWRKANGESKPYSFGETTITTQRLESRPPPLLVTFIAGSSQRETQLIGSRSLLSDSLQESLSDDRDKMLGVFWQEDHGGLDLDHIV